MPVSVSEMFIEMTRIGYEFRCTDDGLVVFHFLGDTGRLDKVSASVRGIISELRTRADEVYEYLRYMEGLSRAVH